MDDSKLYAVIMAGGSGTRFWPASRAERPKQFLPIAGDVPMLRATFDRLEGLVPPERILIVTAASQAELVRECLPDLPAE
ncbi:MAG: sugar phosphate nucleotidyltransferase, partial [Planctomycetota bacterium]